MTSPQRWKRAEREIAALLGGVRLPNNGYGQPAVIAGNLAVHVKMRTSLPTWLLAAMDQSIRDARPEWQPGVILNVVSRGRKACRLLVAALDSVLSEDDDR